MADSTHHYTSLARRALRRQPLSRDALHTVLTSPDDDLLDLVAAVFRVRLRYFGRRVKLNYLVNLRSGLCPEDCSYCSQRVGSSAGVLAYTWLSTRQTREAAARGVEAGAARVCLVGSGRGPADRDLARLRPAIEGIKSDHPGVEVCACLGLLADGQAEGLAACGVDAYNHNLNTSEGHYGDICTTHAFADRVDTVRRATGAGLSPCSGIIAGLGESDDDLVDVLCALRELDTDSVPVNFLIPFDGTPLAGRWELTPQRCLRILAAARLAFPDVEVRLAGGREVHLRGMQPLALHLANSMFLGDYLTSEGQPGQTDRDMIRDAGFTVEGAGGPTLPPERRDLVRTRRRGAGTDVPPNV